MAVDARLRLQIAEFKRNYTDAKNHAKQESAEMRREAGGVGNALSGSFSAGIGGLARFLPAMAAGTGAVNAVKVSVDRKRAAMALAAVSSEDLGDQMDRLRELAKDPALGFDQVVAGTTRLQAVGFSAEQSEAAIREMGNALALVGGGKEQLDGVLLALTQIVAKGTVSAEEINQIAERLPQIRSLMVEAFGTSDTTMLQEMKLGAEEFVNGVVEAASKLERAQATSASAISNLGDEWKNLMQTIGDTVEPVLGPVLGLMSKLIAMAGDVIHVTASAVSSAGFEAGMMLEGLTPEQRAEARRIAAEPGSAASGQKAEADGKGTGSEATQAELFAKKAAREKALKEQEALSEKLADQREAQIVRDREKRAREREQDQREVESLRERATAGEFLLKSPEEQAKQLRDQLSQSLGFDLSAAADFERGIKDLRSQADDARKSGDTAREKELLERINSAQADAMALASVAKDDATATSTAGRGTVAGAIANIFGRSSSDLQLDESKAQTGLLQNINRVLAEIRDADTRDAFGEPTFRYP